jgi:hypothetical protein
MKVILVGNGYSVMDNQMGEYIDKNFDLVYRINRFKTKGFEKYVGSRIDGWFIADTGVQWLYNPTDDIEGSMKFKGFEYVFICMPKFKHNPSGLPLTETIQLLPTSIEDKINGNINLEPNWPTSGLIAIEFLLDNYNKIYIHGFDSQSDNYKYVHYYDEGDEDRLTEKYKKPRIDHNYNKEKEYLNLLRKEKKVIDIV